MFTHKQVGKKQEPKVSKPASKSLVPKQHGNIIKVNKEKSNIKFKPQNVEGSNIPFKPQNIDGPNITFKPQNIERPNIIVAPRNQVDPILSTEHHEVPMGKALHNMFECVSEYSRTETSCYRASSES